MIPPGVVGEYIDGQDQNDEMCMDHLDGLVLLWLYPSVYLHRRPLSTALSSIIDGLRSSWHKLVTAVVKA